MRRTRHRTRPAVRPPSATVLATALITLLAALLVSGCAGEPSAGKVSVVTVTSTVPGKPGPAGSAGKPAAEPAGASSSGVRVQPRPGTSDAAGGPDGDGSSAVTLPSSVRVQPRPGSGPPDTGKPTGKATGKPTTGAPTPGMTVGTSSGSRPGTPPGSLSTGNLIAAATSAAAAAGVAPADPDTPGPQTGPACPADKKYVNEAPAGLRSDVVTAWQRAVAAARTKGITLCLNDGKRSRAQQQAQFDDYAAQYGQDVARQLVLPPEKSAHVVGIAVDAQPADAYRWLQSTKGALGFCRIYDNEPWHFEYNPAYRADGCPARLPEPQG